MTESELPITSAPADPLPPIIETAAELNAAVAKIAAGTGRIGMDAERASGFRYSSRAYLVQLQRAGAGIFLIDPTNISDFSEFTKIVNAAPWILHSATQDLDCLRELGFIPSSLHDTEVAAKLLGKPRVGLAALLETELGIRLEKEHSAADWSQRPLPIDWLNYAALDVEFLNPLVEIQIAELDSMERTEWAKEEFDYLAAWQKPTPKTDLWRRTSGLHQIRNPRGQAVVRELWQVRDQIAAERDKAPGRIFNDAVIIEAAKFEFQSAKQIFHSPLLRNRSHKAHADLIWETITKVKALPESELPPKPPKSLTPPPPKAWAEKFPASAVRWDLIRPRLNELADSLGLSPEVLVSPEPIRKLCFDPGTALLSAQNLQDFLQAENVRNWQINLIEPAILTATKELSEDAKSLFTKTV